MANLYHRSLRFNKGMAIASLNINGLRTHYDEVAFIIQNLGINILALCETELGPSLPREQAWLLTGAPRANLPRRGMSEIT